MIALPHPPRRSELRVFSAAAGLAAGVAVWLLASTFFDTGLAVLLIPAGFAVGVLGALWTAPSLFLYRATAKGVRLLSRVGQAWISLLVFAVIVAAGRVEDPLFLREPRDGTQSSWTPIPDRSALRAAGPPVTGGLAAVVHWIRASGHWWAALLLPLFLVLLALDPGPQPDTAPANTYTLF
jgi:hypothetical protein